VPAAPGADGLAAAFKMAEPSSVASAVFLEQYMVGVGVDVSGLVTARLWHGNGNCHVAERGCLVTVTLCMELTHVHIPGWEGLVTPAGRCPA
jgi:hypothetical protein